VALPDFENDLVQSIARECPAIGQSIVQRLDGQSERLRNLHDPGERNGLCIVVQIAPDGC
jgi:hypothetical protein